MFLSCFQYIKKHIQKVYAFFLFIFPYICGVNAVFPPNPPDISKLVAHTFIRLCDISNTVAATDKRKFLM